MPKKIFVIDDNFTLTSLMNYVLSAEGFEVRSSNCGNVAIQEIKSFKPDLILLDWLMPNFSGKDVLEVLSNDSSLKEIPVFLLTGLAENMKSNEDFQDIQIIEKPFDHDELITKIKEQLHV